MSRHVGHFVAAHETIRAACSQQLRRETGQTIDFAVTADILNHSVPRPIRSIDANKARWLCAPPAFAECRAANSLDNDGSVTSLEEWVITSETVSRSPALLIGGCLMIKKK